MLHDQLVTPVKGSVRIYDVEKPEVDVWRDDNVICNTVRYLVARLLANPQEPEFGIWGLALGVGGVNGVGGWSANAQPDPVPTITSLVGEIKRKQLTSYNYVDSNGNPTTTPTNVVVFQTVINASQDGLTNVSIREMGLLGGGTTVGGDTAMTTAPYFDPTNPTTNSTVLCNYVTVPSFIFPPGVNFAVDWQIQV
jgi:hypothetical protein